jgi:antitoxin PrlF
MKVTVSEKGQVTVPKPLRDRLDIRPGDQLDFTEDAGRLVVSKAFRGDPIASVYGVLKTPRNTDELIRELRGEPDAV